MADWDDVRELALALPETTEAVSSGSPHWRVRNRGFVWERPLRKADLAFLGIPEQEGDVLGASQSGVHSSLKLLRVLTDADLIAQARELAERCIASDPELDDPALADIVTDMEMEAAGDWLERT